ncbi:MAG: YncE family protein [Acidobacteriales bacterium]|nr:YncE family protein [Terriglobales bacterium]
MRSIIHWNTVLILALLTAGFAKDNHPSYQQVAKFTVGGEGEWDYVTFDPAADRVFLAHNKTIEVVDATNGKTLGQIPADGAHGVALVPDKNAGFATNGRAGTVTVFDLKSLKPVRDIKVGENPDAIIYDPQSKRVLGMNGRSKDVMVIDPASLAVTDTVPLGGKLEFAAAGNGHVYVNIEDTAEIADLDSATWKVAHRWKLAGCEEPTGLALDSKAKRLFAVCGNKQMVVVDADTGKITASLPIGEGSDGVVYDPGLGVALSSNGDGTMTVVGATKNHFEVLGNVATQRGARTIALDPASHRVFLITAELGPPAPDQRRPSVQPGTFTLLVFAPR